MGYTAKQIDRMSIQELEQLTYILTPEQMNVWTGSGYDGATFVKLINEQITHKKGINFQKYISYIKV